MDAEQIDAAIAQAHSEPHSKRARLLREAERLFAEQGFTGVRVREVASAADSNVATLHLHWRDKATLYEAVCRAQAQAIRRAIRSEAALQNTQGQSLEERATTWFEVAFDLLASRPEVAKTALQSASDQMPPGLVNLLTHDVAIFEHISRALGELVAGEEDPEQEVILTVLAALYFLIVMFSDSRLQRRLLGGSVVDDDDIRARARAFGGSFVTALFSRFSDTEGDGGAG